MIPDQHGHHHALTVDQDPGLPTDIDRNPADFISQLRG